MASIRRICSLLSARHRIATSRIDNLRKSNRRGHNLIAWDAKMIVNHQLSSNMAQFNICLWKTKTTACPRRYLAVSLSTGRISYHSFLLFKMFALHLQWTVGWGHSVAHTPNTNNNQSRCFHRLTDRKGTNQIKWRRIENFNRGNYWYAFWWPISVINQFRTWISGSSLFGVSPYGSLNMIWKRLSPVYSRCPKSGISRNWKC